MRSCLFSNCHIARIRLSLVPRTHIQSTRYVLYVLEYFICYFFLHKYTDICTCLSFHGIYIHKLQWRRRVGEGTQVDEYFLFDRIRYKMECDMKFVEPFVIAARWFRKNILYKCLCTSDYSVSVVDGTMAWLGIVRHGESRTQIYSYAFKLIWYVVQYSMNVDADTTWSWCEWVYVREIMTPLDE